MDASIRTRGGTTDILVTIECRKRHPKQDVTWIEQLAAKRDAIGASCTIAVSSAGFTANAAAAAGHGIQFRRLAEVSVAEINGLMRIDFVLIPHKRVALARAALRFARTEGWTVPDLDSPADHSARVFFAGRRCRQRSLIDEVRFRPLYRPCA